MKRTRQENSISKKIYFVVDYRIVVIGKIIWCVVVGGISWMIDVGRISWYGRHCWWSQIDDRCRLIQLVWSSLVERQLDDRYAGCAVHWFNRGGGVDVVSNVDASPYSESYVD